MRATELKTESDAPIVLKPRDNSRARAWIDKVYAKYPATFQNNHVMVWGEGDDQELAMFELVPSMSKRDAVEVKWFQAYPLRRGIGSRAMRELQSLAREDGIALTLFPWDKGQVSQAKLMKFYRSVGFNPITKGSKSLYWEPGSEQGVSEGFEQSLSSMVNQDQAERNEYANFVKSQAGGDWDKGAKMYAQLKKRPSTDVFGDASRLNQFMKMKFDFDKFTDEDWDNYWLLAQHCDTNRDFQKNALSIIKKYQGTDHSHYKYLYDRISMGLTGKQKYGTQNVKEQSVTEAFDQPYKLKWEKGAFGDYNAVARDDGNYLNIMFNTGYTKDKEEAWSVEFFRNNSQEVTGEGDAQRVFATVLTAIGQFIKKKKPLNLFFSASKLDPTANRDPEEPRANPASRAKLYTRLVQRYAAAWGYSVNIRDEGSIVRYRLEQLTENIAESSDDRALAFKAHLIKTMPQIMKLFANVGKGWKPSEEQMLAAVDTGYTVMKNTGDTKQAGKAVMDELNTLHRMSQGQQGVSEGTSGMFSKVMGHETSPEAAKLIQQQGFKKSQTGIFFNIGDQNYSGGGYGGTMIMAKVFGPIDDILNLEDDNDLPDDLDDFADSEEIANYARNEGYWAWTDGVQFVVLDTRHIQIIKQGVAEGFSNDMSTKDMIAYLRQHHDENLHPDYLNHLTSTNSKFILKNIPINSIDTELPGLDRTKVEQYKQMDFSKAPPIVVGSDGYILDGYHRATVAKALGIPTIKAYVGVKSQQGVAEGSDELLEQGKTEDEIHNYKKLDRILYKLCDLIKKGQASDRDYGLVAAAVLDPDNNLVARLNRPGRDGKRIHAERAALEAYTKRYGDVPEGSIILTTLSPCNDYMDERDGPSCTDIVNASGIKKVYCGYTDPTHETDTRQFNIMETADPKLRKRCKQIADTFLKQGPDEVKSQLDERATDIVYHYTSIHNAYNILQTGSFLLSNASGTGSEAQYAPAGYPYFLSTSRSKSGDYHRYVGSGGVMFVLDGRWLSDRYPVKPIDYWYSGKTPQNLKAGEWRTIDPAQKRAMWQFSPERGRESEDRVFSKDNSIPIDCVTSMHLLLKNQDDRRSRLARRILIDAKKRNIPIYLYTSEDDWRTQNIRNAVPPSSVKDLLISTEKERHYAQRPVRGLGASEYGRSGLLNWVELIKKQPGQPLSKAADKLRYNLMYYDDTYTVLANDIHNARKPDSNEYDLGVRLSSYMQKHNLTPKSLQNSLRDKWRTPRPKGTVNENDAQHREQLQKTGFWGRRGAGCLFLARDTGKICIAHRSQFVEQPGTWGTWGGALDDNETPADAVKREAREEAGYHGDPTLVPLYMFSHESGFRYYNFLALIDSEFTPSLNWETQGYRWVDFGDWPQPLHPGMASLLSHPASVETIKKYSLEHTQSDSNKK